MASMICPECGTRNRENSQKCRRCGAAISPGETETGSAQGDEEELRNLVVGERWRIEEAMPDAYGRHLFIGRDVTTGRSVLIKRLSHQAARDRAIRSRFLKEARILSELDHQHVVSVIEVVEDGAIPALVMPYPSGEPLSEMLSRLERLPLTVTITFVLQILDALDYVHAQGVVHRNLRPSNIFVGPDPQTGLPRVTIVDFGTAGSSSDFDEPSQTTGTLMGMRVGDSSLPVIPSPYVAPELLSDNSDASTDIYSVGVIMFEMLTGRPPIASGVTDPDLLIAAIKEESPTLLGLLRPEAPERLHQAMARMMAKDPDDRYFDVAQTRLALMSADVEPMVAIPRGPFLRGSSKDDPNGRDEERPMRELELSAFYIDRNPVTVAQFQKFIDATEHEVPDEFARHNPPQKADHPVVFVTWDEASAYASWAGKRLPTEAEWEKAARGTDGRQYPWGNEPPTESRAVFGGKSGTEPVSGRPEGASPFGAQDMAGNAFEWVADWYSRSYYADCSEVDPAGPETGKKRILRGGSFVHQPFALRCATRGRYEPHERRANHSFRCAWSLV